MLKKYIAFILSWTLFWMVHGISKLMNYDSLERLYYVYSFLMTKSLDVQEWAENSPPWGPWGPPSEDIK